LTAQAGLYRVGLAGALMSGAIALRNLIYTAALQAVPNKSSKFSNPNRRLPTNPSRK
jgi:hypothetical protein